MSGVAGEGEGAPPADTGEATDASATRKRLLQSNAIATIQSILDMGAMKVVCACELWRWGNSEDQSFQNAASHFERHFKNEMVHFSSTLANVVTALQDAEKRIIVIVNNITSPSNHP